MTSCNSESDRPSKLLRLSQVLERFPVSRSTWYAGVQEGRFPKPIKLGPNSVAWDERDIANLIDRLREQGR